MTQYEDLSTLAVDMDFRSYNDILTQREQALHDGVYIPSAGDFVTATIRLDRSAVPVRMRLLEGPSDHLGVSDKWGFEVRTRQNRQLLGMQRFYLSDPAANHWLNQWAFARALEREGILAADYHFVHFFLNGDARGIYALQEGFGNELLAANSRPEGVIVRFDTDVLWESVAHFQGDVQAAYADSVANLSATDFQYFEVDAFRDAAIAQDSNLSAQRDRAITLLRGLQTGDLAASDVFDAEKYGRFLALVDLWGAIPATSLVNLRFYYNPTTDRLEPIGFNANPLSSDERISLAATYDDPILQAAYAKEAWRISQPEYLTELQTELGPEYDRLAEVVSPETGEIDFVWDELRRRQELIQLSLRPVQPVFAYLGPPELAMNGTVRIDVANVLNLPVEILGFDINGATFLPAQRHWLQDDSSAALIGDAEGVVLRALDKTRAPVIRFARFHVPLTEILRLDSETDFMQEMEVQVVTRVLGLRNERATPAQPGYPDVFNGED